MPRAAAYTLSWSEARQTYILCDQHTKMEELALEAHASAWQEFLVQAASFAFRGRQGTYTARREQVKQGDWYWYAYQRSQKRVRKKYLGKGEVLTLQRLEEVAGLFAADGEDGKNGGATKQATTGKEIHSLAREELLAAKLRVPLIPQHLVERTRLIERLHQAQARSLTLICAPAGSGKSTLLSSWLRAQASLSAWVSLDASDNDTTRFWSYLFTAIDALYPGAGTYALRMLHTPQRPTIERVLTLLLNLLENEKFRPQKSNGEALLVLDDYHMISDESVHQGLTFLVEHLPAHLHIVIAARHDPPLPLARLRVCQLLLELRADDLRFTSEETLAFFAHHGKAPLTHTEISLLEERTAGWAAGLQMVALLLHGQPKAPNVLESLKGSQSYIAEYLGQEVLAHLPERIQQFLLRTSILSQLDAQLCEAVSAQPNGEETLNWLYQANLFLTPLDETRRWYRYHQVFADMLLQRLQQSAATLVPELHRRASLWYREQGMLAEAVAHARSSGDWESIANIAEEAGVELISRGNVQMVMNWVAMLPRLIVFSRLRLFLYECWWRWYAGHAAVVAEMMREYIQQHALPDLEIEDVATLEQTISAHVDMLYPRSRWGEEQRANRIAEMLALYGVLNMERPDGAAFSQAVCRRAVVRVAGMAHRARIAQHLSTVSILRGDLFEATATLEDALASAIADGSVTWMTSTGYRLVMLYEMMGQLHDVTRISQDILELAKGKAFLTQGTAYIFLGNIEYERNNLETAEHYFRLAIASCEEIDLLTESDSDVHFLLGQLGLARIQFIRKDIAGVRLCLEEIAGFLSQKWVGNEVLPAVKGEYALLMHDLGDDDTGYYWLQEYVLPEHSDQLVLRQFISLKHNHYRLYIKLLLTYQRWQEAEQVLQSQQMLAEQQGRTGNLILWLTLRALLEEAQGNAGQALSSITRALSLAEPRGYLRVFLDEGAPLLTLLYRLRDELRKQRTTENPAPASRYLDRLILLCKQEQQMGVPSGEQAELVESLSERECEVLRHISEGRSNREIARQLVIALSTVKSHIRAIYAKLGVKSRTQALIQARRLNLL
ncbi:LuxR C-terminal-related transcriptional regulator [Ktedonobacter racemifer]|uniref:ATP-dependent transcriptional regulator, MalT-like, LuxR family n=1 Tax=Ktedonobacter racemifer DSM 44963 TaxID=485913 RepID=D6TYB1_KTERA|nr:LuxR C-terminal-related transcriptional regulator [Ktedonobacter racemifer]EFH83191.1 ATP-dependent transcriptional regulator, MalT-like, LuxR family [Ktedonobacter racemifer DSM 44963]